MIWLVALVVAAAIEAELSGRVAMRDAARRMVHRICRRGHCPNEAIADGDWCAEHTEQIETARAAAPRPGRGRHRAA